MRRAMRVDLGGGALLFVSGQVAVDASGQVVGRGAMARQAGQVFEDLRRSSPPTRAEARR